jgi:hypothetical protein
MSRLAARRLECVRDATAPLAALLPDVLRAPVVRDVLLDAKREWLRYGSVRGGAISDDRPYRVH